MNKRSILILVSLIIIGFAAGAAYVLLNSDQVKPQARTDYVPNDYSNTDKFPSSAAPKPDDVPAPKQSSAEVTKEGTIICLKPKDATGPQNMSCAIGLQSDDGKSYALVSNDPSVVGSLPNGQKVRVFGLLTQSESTYDIAGVIKLKTIDKI